MANQKRNLPVFLLQQKLLLELKVTVTIIKDWRKNRKELKSYRATVEGKMPQNIK